MSSELQELKCAAYCSQLTVDDVVADYARYYGAEVQANHTFPLI
jgi:hypothetical protein